MLDLHNPLRSYRLDRNLSYVDLASAIGVSRSVMVAIEDGRRTVSLEQRDVLAKRLGVDPGKLDYLVAVTPK